MLRAIKYSTCGLCVNVIKFIFFTIFFTNAKYQQTVDGLPVEVRAPQCGKNNDI